LKELFLQQFFSLKLLEDSAIQTWNNFRLVLFIQD
jgi:hypothetical protein